VRVRARHQRAAHAQAREFRPERGQALGRAHLGGPPTKGARAQHIKGNAMRGGHASRTEAALQSKRTASYLLFASAKRNSCRRAEPVRRNFGMLPMNANTTKAADAFLWSEPHASSTGLMLSLSRASQAVSEWSRRRRAMAELNALTDRELADIGLTRGEIADAIRGSRRR
jgi:uncharacterized protein YjiS (DUF1127 family)